MCNQNKPVILQKYCVLYQICCLLFHIIGEILQTLGTWSLASNMPSTRTSSRARNSPKCPWSADVIRSWQTVFASYKQKYENLMRFWEFLIYHAFSVFFALKKMLACVYCVILFKQVANTLYGRDLLLLHCIVGGLQSPL